MYIQLRLLPRKLRYRVHGRAKFFGTFRAIQTQMLYASRFLFLLTRPSPW